MRVDALQKPTVEDIRLKQPNFDTPAFTCYRKCQKFDGRSFSNICKRYKNHMHKQRYLVCCHIPVHETISSLYKAWSWRLCNCFALGFFETEDSADYVFPLWYSNVKWHLCQTAWKPYPCTSKLIKKVDTSLPYIKKKTNKKINL